MSVEAVVANLLKNVATAQRRARARAAAAGQDRAARAAASALGQRGHHVAQRPSRPRTRKRLGLLLDRYFPPKGKARRG